MNVIEEFAKLSQELNEKLEQVKELQENAKELRDRAKKIEAEAEALKAEVEIGKKYSALFEQFMEQQNAFAKSEDADFRSYTQKVCEFVADDEGFNRVTAEYRKSRRLPDSDVEDAPDEKESEELHRVA